MIVKSLHLLTNGSPIFSLQPCLLRVLSLCHFHTLVCYYIIARSLHEDDFTLGVRQAENNYSFDVT